VAVGSAGRSQKLVLLPLLLGCAVLANHYGLAWQQVKTVSTSTSGRDTSTEGVLSRRDVMTSSVGLGSVLSSTAAVAEEAPRIRGDEVVLSNGMRFAVASFGLQVYSDATAERLTKMSLDVGYRNFFSSVLAQNQVGFAKGVQGSSVPRSELFICGSVLSNEARTFDQGYKVTKRGCDENLKAFAAGGIDYVDMIMLDYPARNCAAIQGQWKAFEEMLEAGQTKSLAVSNFSPEQLDCILEDPNAKRPVLNQLLYGVGYENEDAVAENKKRGVVVQAWSPLGNLYGNPFANGQVRATCTQIGKKYGKSGAQVALKWIEQTGATFTTQTKKREHFVEDLDIFDFKLSDEDMKTLSALRG